MNFLRLCTLSMLALCAATTAQAQVSLKFSPKYEVGKVFTTEGTMKTDQTMVIAGMNVKTGAENFMKIKEEVTEIGDSGVQTRNAFEVMQINLELGGGIKFQFDSGSPAANPVPIPQLQPLKDLYVAMAGSQWETVYGDDGQATSVKYVGEPFKDLPEEMRAEAGPDRFKTATNQEISRLPTDPVSQGDSWERDEVIEIGSGQTFQVRKQYTYAGVAEQNGKEMHKITGKILELKYEVAGSIGPLEVKDNDLKAVSSTGTYWYDAAQGIVVEFEDEMNVAGSITFGVNGMELPGTVDLTMVSKGRIK